MSASGPEVKCLWMATEFIIYSCPKRNSAGYYSRWIGLVQSLAYKARYTTDGRDLRDRPHVQSTETAKRMGYNQW
jgi:hypothetical protein